MKLNRVALKITLLYITIGVIWILSSDIIVGTLFHPKYHELMQTCKGWFYVIITGVLLYKLIETYVDKINKNQEILVHKEKLSSIGEMSAMISHEFRNILAVVRILLETKEFESNKDQVYKQIERANELTDNIKGLTLFNNQTKEKVNLIEIINEQVKFQKIFCKKEDIEIIKNIPKDYYLTINKNQIQHVFLNLFNNSRHALKNKKDKYIKIEVTGTKDCVKISFIDNGEGIKKENQSKVFDSFYTTKYNQKESGSGLGLSICKSIILSHKGSIKVITNEKNETEFIIKLPIHE